MSFTTYISIDVATRSLAIGAYRMRTFNDIIANAPPATDPLALNTYCDSIIQPLAMRVFDINAGAKTKDTSIAEKAVALKRTLTQFDDSLTVDPGETIVLIEYQMNANHTSNAIFNMILYHYADRYPVYDVKASMKNTIALHPRLVLSEFLATASSNYKANKEHTKHNMLYLLTALDCLYMVDDIKKKNLDDIADTLCQALAWHKKRCA